MLLQPDVTARRARIVAAARGWLGTPYQHQASLRGVGCDCLGLLRGVWREVIGPEPEAITPYTPAWAELDPADPLLGAARRHLVGVAERRPGAVVIFRWREGVSAKHCGILTAPGRMIHAHDGACVAEVTIVPGWARRIAGVFDFPEGMD
jgi:NlpC/P60 family putative phage cell wall peptidase